MRPEGGVKHPFEVSEIFVCSLFILALSIAHVTQRSHISTAITSNGGGKDLLQICFVGVVVEGESQRQILTAELVG